ncbi:amidase [Caballeronia sp. LZ065]|uniref:amidase n=1 Tax=Caballeronia sp. LZ065 TaxID=3038571 RepID=UPI0028594F52|nr:amidase [Caballeronia sp. LZ065]MDR5781259.1 amidase [Caballeronia sp. LZ065]
MKELHQQTATALLEALSSRRVSAQQVAESCLAQIDACEARVQAWHYLDRDQVMARARRLDAGENHGPLHGIPIGFKDIIDTADMPTEYGTPIHRGHRPRIDAACVALARRAGANVFGKTVTTEFANRFPGKTTNPFDASRTPGGSSSGSAAAVGACMVPLAVGTQTTSSTIRPASFCGGVGFRPTHGEMRVQGVMEASASLDTLGLMARSVDDIALLRDVLLGLAPQALAARDLRGLRVGLPGQSILDQCDASTQQSLDDCARALSKSGAHVSEVDLPPEFELLDDAHRWISSFEFARNRAWEIDHHWNAISETLRENRIHDGLTCSIETYQQARRLVERCRLQLDATFAGYDVFQIPAAAGEAPVGLSSTGNAAFCTTWSAVHVPALSLPLCKGPHGLPVGVQYVAARGEDRTLLAAAKSIMQVFA